jgi:N-acyl-phosphatidylethanolamine-hydrolysing phospholipase D
MSKENSNDPDRANAASLVPQTKPTWGTPADTSKLKATWLGHAAYLVEMPTAPSPSASSGSVSDGTEKGGAQRGVRILFDPAFSKRCSPVQRFGPPPRYTGQCPPWPLDSLSWLHSKSDTSNYTFADHAQSRRAPSTSSQRWTSS